MEDIAICLDILEQKNWDLMVRALSLAGLVFDNHVTCFVAVARQR